ncbi:MAG TPA: aldo/keto reductase [Patescibacteria group bacterium]|nr:aldo/keto reductase [Patescibacteria group bacterium]
MNKVPQIKLANGKYIPQIGLGLWQIKDQNEFDAAFRAAIDNGYTHFDTAQAYGNEQFLGNAWNRNNIKREDIFITTKIQVTHFTSNKLRESFKTSLENLKTDYVDLLLLHFPVPLVRKHAWLELEKLNSSGQAKSIGVSNYMPRHIEEMDSYASQKPVINQVELHIFLQQPDLIKFCHERQIQIEAYSPLAHGHMPENPTITKLMEKYNKTYAQIVLRWLVEQQIVIIPKSVTPARIAENINIFDFKLSDDDMNEIANLNLNKRYCWSPERIP